jgi:phage terminase large subunit-like protein
VPARKIQPALDPLADLAEEVAAMSAAELAAFADTLTDADYETLEHALGRRGKPGDRYFPEARTKQQIPPGLWLIWLIMAGRGFGKTRTGAEWTVEQASGYSANYAVIGPTFADGRDICIEGRGDDGKPSGVLSVLERRGVDNSTFTWNRSMGELRLANGSLIKVLSGEKPERVRGWNFAGAWCDELGSWSRPDTFHQLRLALRIGERPQLVVTGTPRPTALLRSLVTRATGGDPTVIVTRGATRENAENLSAAALAELEARYGGTRLGRQELEGELLEDVEGALWKRSDILQAASAPKLLRIMVGVDPSTWGEDTGAEHDTVGQGVETGIVVVGLSNENPSKCYVLQDLSGRHSPHEWGALAVGAAKHWQATAPTWIVPETNAGGAMVTNTLRGVDPSARIYSENGRVGVHASKGKRARAEPVAGLYEQHRVLHVGSFEILTDQMCEWDASMPWSPDRVDALVWAITALKPWSGAVAVARSPERRPGKPKPAQRATGVRGVGRARTRGAPSGPATRIRRLGQ